ncbi:MAG: ATP-binding protein [Coriobacteriaceae bacterium]|nr:ATP-binding protein [Coriobacteriaceae bacterium]
MSEDFYPFVDSGDPAPDNSHLTGKSNPQSPDQSREDVARTYATRISVYDDLLSTPRVIVVEQEDVRTYLEDVTNTVYRTMKEQGGRLSLMIIRELVENFIHAQFSEPVISIMDDGDTIRFADQGPGINDKERAFEFGVTSADRNKKRYIRGTGAGLPMVQQYVENAGGAISVEDNLGAGTVVTVSVNPARVAEIERAVSRGAAVRSGQHAEMPTPQQAPAPIAGQAPITGPNAMGTAAYGALPQEAYAQAYAGYQAQFPEDQPMNAAAPYPATPQGIWPGYPGQAPAYPYGMNPYGQNMPQPYPGNPYPAGYAAQPAPAGWPGQPMGAYPQAEQFPGQAPADAAWQPFAQQPAQPVTGGAPAQPAVADPYISERGTLAMRLIAQNGKGGPTDLTRAFGNSDATWSRELDALASTGLIYKRGQKYVLTDLGQSWAQKHQ